MKKNITFLIVFYALTSCSDTGLFTNNIIEIKRFQQESRLTGIPFTDDELYAYYDVVCVDNKYIVLFSTPKERGHFFSVYNIAGDSLGSFGDKGQGPNDLFNNRWTGQFYDASIWINDVTFQKLHSINIEKSLSAKHCVFDRTVTLPVFSINSFICNDSILISEQIEWNNIKLIQINLNNTKEIKEDILYHYPVADPFSTYRSLWRLKPDGTKMASAMHAVNMINILNLTDDSRMSLVIYPPAIKLSNIMNAYTDNIKWVYYVNMEVTDKYIYALYYNQVYEESFDIEKEVEIHVFDWQGNAVHKYIIPQYIRCMAIDEDNNRIYGMSSMDEQLYVYNLK
jgi:hypothetical protein